jgi:hypothetical protein
MERTRTKEDKIMEIEAIVTSKKKRGVSIEYAGTTYNLTLDDSGKGKYKFYKGGENIFGGDNMVEAVGIEIPSYFAYLDSNLNIVKVEVLRENVAQKTVDEMIDLIIEAAANGKLKEAPGF